ncbi:hypothetical protein FOXB_00774 [Fusarium oxysporum f. sp. conglutinans Fo5176]|uniref:Uncharacterized protein n=1 Tax=Fusarium oxysporum (strain Fo5176) TaxID=660025 RepID=F9F2Z9_FUSOF|nr:hypothetical protein FOXB_00774 [Fusarium oxysporum f. sp. conglutinans Fo5176]
MSSRGEAYDVWPLAASQPHVSLILFHRLFAARVTTHSANGYCLKY